MNSAKHSTKLTGVEAGRGVAALLVAAVHARSHIVKAFGVPTIADVFTFGHAGVDFFFVLSGFIILFVHARDISQPRRLAHYVGRRFTRIFPFYWVMLGLTLASLALASHWGTVTWQRLVVSVLLLPASVEPLLDVAWTLKNELVFYTLFATLILNRWLGTAVLGAWLALLVICVGSDVAQNVPLDTFNIHFFFGLAAAWMLRRWTLPRPWLLLVGGVIVFALIGAAEDLGLVPGPDYRTHLAYAAASMSILTGVVELERQGRIRIPRLMASLGSASYSIYLTHLLGIGITWQVILATHLQDTLPLWLDFVLLVAGAVAAGWVMSLAVERPLLAAVRRMMAHRGSASRAVVAGGDD